MMIDFRNENKKIIKKEKKPKQEFFNQKEICQDICILFDKSWRCG